MSQQHNYTKSTQGEDPSTPRLGIECECFRMHSRITSGYFPSIDHMDDQLSLTDLPYWYSIPRKAPLLLIKFLY